MADLDKLNKLDKIEISTDELVKIRNWVKSNEDKLKIANPILNEGVIEFTDDNASIYFKIQSEYLIHFEYYSSIDEYKIPKTLIVSFNLENIYTMYGKIIGFTGTNNFGWLRQSDVKFGKIFNTSDEEKVKPIQEHMIGFCKSTFLNVMTYAQFYREIMTYNTRRYSKSTGNKKTSSKKNGKVKLTRVYKLNLDDVRLDKRIFIRHTEYWTVRGHWRTTKTGKQVWIKPFAKGNKEKVSGKTYKI